MLSGDEHSHHDITPQYTKESNAMLSLAAGRNQQTPIHCLPGQYQLHQTIYKEQAFSISHPSNFDGDGPVQVVGLNKDRVVPSFNPIETAVAPTQPSTVLRLSRRSKRRHVEDCAWGNTKHRRRRSSRNLSLSEVEPESQDPCPAMRLSTTANHQEWSDGEMSLLRVLVGLYTENGHWERIAEEFPGRTANACALQWSRLQAEEENRQKRVRTDPYQETISPAINITNIPAESTSEEDQGHSMHSKKSIRAIKKRAVKSGRWSTAEDESLIAGVTAYLATHGLEIHPPVYIFTENDKAARHSSSSSTISYEDICQNDCGVTDLDFSESTIDPSCSASCGDVVNGAPMVLTTGALTPSFSQVNSPLPNTSGRPPGQSALLSSAPYSFDDGHPWLSACHRMTEAVEIMDSLAFGRPSLDLINMNPFLQPNGSATVVLDDQNLEPLNLDAGGNSSDMVAIQIGRMLSGDIRATHQEHNRLQFSSDHHHNPAMDVKFENLQAVFPQLGSKTSLLSLQYRQSLQDADNSTDQGVARAQSVSLDLRYLPLSPLLACSPLGPSQWRETVSTPMAILPVASPTRVSSTSSTNVLGLLPHSGPIHQYNACNSTTSDFHPEPPNIVFESTTSSMSFGAHSSFKTIPRAAFESREAYNLAISRAMSHCPWSLITARSIPGRTGVQAQARWSEALDPQVKKGPWTPQEDALLLKGVQESSKCWIWIADSIPGRTQRQCRTRWVQISTRAERQTAAALAQHSE